MVVKIDPRDRVVLFTGAGMSAESGIPTFRGEGGTWSEYDWQQYACQEAFDEAPGRVWEFHNMRREVAGGCVPNRGHELVATLETLVESCVVVTQNVDGLHQKAGSNTVLELHGSLWRVRCDTCGRKKRSLDAPFTTLACPCGHGLWRPDVVWFGDRLDPGVVEASIQAISRCTKFIAVGTSALVQPAASLPGKTPREATLIEVNLDDTPQSHLYDFKLRGKASDILAGLVEGRPYFGR